MPHRLTAPVTLLACATVLAAGITVTVAETSSARVDPAARAATADCTAGAHTLGTPGDVLYPEVGNGGYTSVHTDVHTVYDAQTNRFLRGNRVTLTDRATQCLQSFSLDFERSEPGDPAESPHMRVLAVRVDGRRASYRFVQPTYPGDPNGQDDPSPLAHEVSQHDPVGGPQHNPLPPACSPELPTANAPADAQDGDQCPRDKLVITPRAPIADGARFHVTVSYVGRPGLHHDGDGSEEGWFRTPGGNSMTTEPVGAEDWMPLNDYPAAKPTYDFTEVTERGLTAIANGERVSVRDDPPDAEFPHGSTTTRWRADFPIASYLPLTIIGDYSLTRHVVDGRPYYVAQDLHISARRRARNLAVMRMQPEITRYEEQWNGRFPFPSDGVVAGIPGTGDDTEEMESMIVFTGGEVDKQTLYHENMHQWWGDHVTEANFDMTFFKEGMAVLAEKLMYAREWEHNAGGPRTAAGRRAFTNKLISEFNAEYDNGRGFWRIAPSHTWPYTLLADDAVYERPASAYIALWRILGQSRFQATLRAIQHRYGGRAIDEAQLEAEYAAHLPDRSTACEARLTQFFTEWFDTAYPTSAGAGKPDITGPGLHGGDFFTPACPAPGAS